ncbi:MAG TPA: hypothetical protein VK663_15635 [Burkholderiales bacterium]|nr:hypothetical protein [Burkholderiales bacterium]
MQKRPIAIALAVAGIIAGTHAGIAAINSEITGNVAEPVALKTEPQQAATEAQAPAEGLAPVDAQATVESKTPVAQAPVESLVQPRWALTPTDEPLRLSASTKDDEYYVRIPFTNKRIKVTNPTFPRSSSEFPDPLPSVVAYFDQKNANTKLAGAAGSVFPSGGDQAEPLPAVAAYFDRLEASRLAASNPPPATTAATAPPAVILDSQAQATATPSSMRAGATEVPGT